MLLPENIFGKFPRLRVMNADPTARHDSGTAPLPIDSVAAYHDDLSSHTRQLEHRTRGHSMFEFLYPTMQSDLAQRARRLLPIELTAALGTSLDTDAFVPETHSRDGFVVTVRSNLDWPAFLRASDTTALLEPGRADLGRAWAILRDHAPEVVTYAVLAPAHATVARHWLPGRAAVFIEAIDEPAGGLAPAAEAEMTAMFGEPFAGSWWPLR